MAAVSWVAEGRQGRGDVLLSNAGHRRAFCLHGTRACLQCGCFCSLCYKDIDGVLQPRNSSSPGEWTGGWAARARPGLRCHCRASRPAPAPAACAAACLLPIHTHSLAPTLPTRFPFADNPCQTWDDCVTYDTNRCGFQYSSSSQASASVEVLNSPLAGAPPPPAVAPCSVLGPFPCTGAPLPPSLC